MGLHGVFAVCLLLPILPAMGADSVSKIRKAAIAELAAKFERETQGVSTKLQDWDQCIARAVAAGRLKDSDLSRERTWFDSVARTVKESRYATAESYLGTSFSSQEPDQVTAVKRALLAALRSREDQCVVPLRGMFRQICRDAAGVWKTARTPEDLAPAVEVLTYLNQTIPQRDLRDTKGSLPIEEALRFLDRTSAFFAGDPGRPARTIVSEINQLTRSGEQLSEQLSTAEQDAWRERVLGTFDASLEAARGRLQELMTREVSAKDFHEGIIALEKAIDRSQEARGNPDSMIATRARMELRLYTDWGAALNKIEIQDWPEALKLLDDKRYGDGRMPPEIVRAFAEKRAACKAGLAKAIEAETERARWMWAEKLAGIQSAADAASVATEVAAWIQKTRIEARHPEFEAFAQELNGLGAVWAKLDSSRTQHFQSLGKTQSDYRVPHAWTKDLALLRERIIRSELARLGPAPELLAAPLRDLPLHEAVNRMTADLASKGEWERTYSVLHLHSTAYGGSDSEEASAIKSFLTAQRLEEGAIFRLAAMEYRAVLDCVSDRVPIKQATERMKQLNLRHPEVFEAMSKRPAPTN